MAGEIEEPFSVQMASLHSSSISFGRFEPESLSWERRSSFSHNRYLEEVEKYSTPGSVTEKKAYFEAHFKKKALLRQSSEFQNEMTDQTSSNDGLDDMSYNDEFVHSNDEYCCPNDEQTKDSLDFHGEFNLLNYKRENEEVISPNFSMEASAIDEVQVADGGPHCSEPIDAQQSLPVHDDTVVLNKGKSGLVPKDNITDEAENVTEVESADPMPKHQDVQNEDALSLKKVKEPSLKGSDKGQLKAPKPKVRSQASGLVQRKVSSEITKSSVKNSKKGDREGLREPKTEKQIRPKVPLNALSHSGAMKSEDPKKPKLKSSQENKSEKDGRAKRVSTPSVPQRATSDKIVRKTCQSTNRAIRNAITRSDAKPSTAVFSFKSDERAEKRKEFFMKLEEKMHAKEAEMNQIQAKTQVKAKAEIKQLRRSLNFKATPMPPFYHESVPRDSDAEKVSSAQTKPINGQSKLTSPGIRPVRLPAVWKPGSQPEFSTESANTTRHSQEFESVTSVSGVPSEPSTLISPPPLACSRRVETVGKNERNTEAQKHRGGTVLCKSRKGERGETMRKMKGLGLGGSSGMGRLPVGVAS